MGNAEGVGGVFERLMIRDLSRRAAVRGAYALGATAFETTVLLALAAITAHLAAQRPAGQPAVDVVFVRQAPRRPAPPPPPPPVAARRAPTSPKAVVASRPAPPAALIQPREVAPEIKMPDPGEPVEEYDESGVEGGVVGGAPGGVSGGTMEPYGRGGELEEAPQYVTSGFRRPAEAVPGCLRGAIRVPPDLAGYVSGPVTVKFAVGREGAVGRVEVVGAALDERLVEVIRRGLRACRWLPGADAQGRPVSLWVVMPLRFASG
jgi:protein TonB